jgi:hypothetical protein
MGCRAQGLELARHQPAVTNILNPAWGEPELLMNLAWSNLYKNDPDVNAAEQYARSALRLVPYWHYVRDLLLPQVLRSKSTLGEQHPRPLHAAVEP